MKILLIRHGETEVNNKGLMHRKNDISELSERGNRQSQLLRHFCGAYDLGCVYASDELRAMQTARWVCGNDRVPLQVHPALCERNWGAWADKSWRKIENDLKQLSRDARMSFRPPEGESVLDVQVRIMRFFNRILSLPESMNVALVTHTVPFRLLNAKMTGSHPLTMQQAPNGCAQVFSYERGHFEQIAQFPMVPTGQINT